MKKAKTTKRALLSSLMALILCMSMFVGTTFAWFTDSVTSANNVITAGNLDIELDYWDGTSWKTVKGSSEILDAEALWEPGYTDVVYLRMQNVGSLALKYQLGVNIVSEKTGTNMAGQSFKLSDYIYFDVAEDVNGETASYANREAAMAIATEETLISKGYSKVGSLAAESAPVYLAMVIYMPESTGNEANHNGKDIPEIELGINLVATQDTVEADSFDEYYDGGAAWYGDIDLSWYDPSATELTVSSAEQVAGLAAIVNGTATAPVTTFATTAPATVHDDFAGKTVKLASDIDLNGVEWTPIGRIGATSTDFTYAFRGTFDGQGHTVKNLKVSNEGWAGLFGIAYKAEIKNVTVSGANIESNRMAGSIVGQLYGSIDNCHVENANITVVPNWTGSAYDNGDKVGGIVGWLGDNNNNHHIIGCTADNVTIKAYRDVAGIVGYVAWSTTVENNKVTNSTIIGDQSVNFYGAKDYNAGEIYGRASVSGTGAGINDINNTHSNVTVKTVNIIADSDDLKDVLANGGEYTLAQDIAVTEMLTVPAGVTVVLDLNGKTISQTKSDLTTAHALIDNKGNLTIKDSVGTGKISFTDATPYTSDINFASNTIRNTGTLTVEGGTIENLTSDEVADYSYPHAIDAYQGSVTTINGGTVKSLNYDCIRMFCNSETLATKVVINNGTIINRVSFQDPQSTRPGYGILEINGGNFVTMNGVTANVRLLNFCKNCSNMKATVTGGTFDKGFKTQDIAGSGITTADWLTYEGGIPVNNLAELQAALDAAVDGDVIKLIANIEGDVTATQKAGVKITIDGNGKTFAGTITVDGKSATYTTAGLTIKNVKFVADSISADACINLGKSGDNNTRYTCNVTVDNCTFDVPGAVGVKSYTGGDKNLTITGCTATANAHSLAQLKGVDGVLIEECTINSVRGINFNNSLNITVKKSTIDVQKYALRFGESANDTVEKFEIIDCTLISDCVEGDAVIVLRAGATNANLTITNTTIKGDIPMSGHESATVVIK